MSVLGPISTLQAAQPAGILREFDYIAGEMPSAVVHTRTSRATRITKDGVIEIVEAGLPALSWVPRVMGYGVQVEPASTNVLVTSAARPVGWNHGSGATVTPGQLAPDGSNTAVRVSGARTGNTYQQIGACLAANCFAAKWIYKPEDSTVVRFVVRNHTTSVDFGGGEFDPKSGTITSSAQVFYASQKLAHGFWEIEARVLSGLAVGDMIVVYNQSTSAGTIPPHCMWYGQAEFSPFPTSLIIPSTTAQSRAASSVSMPIADVWDAATGGIIFVHYSFDTGPGATGYPEIGATIDARNRAIHRPPPRGESFMADARSSIGGAEHFETGSVGNSGQIRSAVQQLVGARVRVALNGKTNQSQTNISGMVPAYTNIKTETFGACRFFIHRVRVFGSEIDLARATAL